jgi:hypothetical protein
VGDGATPRVLLLATGALRPGAAGHSWIVAGGLLATWWMNYVITGQ